MSQHEKEHEETHEKVRVTVDSKPKEVEAGIYLVAEFKRLVGVDPSKELEEVIEGLLVPLADDAKITIKGGEVFVSHVRHGGAS